MPWAFFKYPWEALSLANASTPENGIRPDNGGGILLHGEPHGVLERLSTGLTPVTLSDSSVWLELPGPSFRSDGPQDLTLQLPGNTESSTLEYQDDSLPKTGSWPAKFHGMLTDSLQELASLLYEERKRAYNDFLELPLAETIRTFLTKHDDDFASRALICELASDLPHPIQEIVERPRRLLQRRHAQVGLDRLQEMDVMALIDYARRPGSTPMVKAGERQRLMGVVREESANTLENRVVHDFCRRARVAGKAYIEEECARCPQRKQCNGDERRNKNHDTCSQRVRQVDAFVRRCEQFLMSPTLTSVTPLAVPCRLPNFALLENVRYVKVWEAYQKLLQQEDVRDQTWRWKRRAWTDYIRACMMEVLRTLTLNGHPPVFRASSKPLRILKEPQFGCWLKPEPFDGPLVFEDAGHYISLYLFNQADVSRAFTGFGSPIDMLNADLYWVAVSTGWEQVRIMPVWTLVGDARWQSHEKAKELRRECLGGIELAGQQWQAQANATPGDEVADICKLLLVRASENPDVFTRDGRTSLIEMRPDKGDMKFLKRHMERLLNEVMA